MANAELQVEKDRLVDGLAYLEGGTDEYKANMDNIWAIHKLEQSNEELKLKERELTLKERELDIKEKDPSLGDRVLDWAKTIAPVLAATVGGIFSLVTIRHITRHEKEDDLYYGSKAMSFVKKP